MIRGYTNIEQSRKLAEILPLETADMYYALSEDKSMNVIYFGKPQGFFDKTQVAWSLAALLNVLPRVDIEKEICSDDTYDYRVKAYIGDGYIGDWYDNPIDACVDMVICLNELKIL